MAEVAEKAGPHSSGISNLQKITYSLGSLGSSISSQSVGAFVVFFYADILKLPIHLIGYGMFAYGLWNAINDPLLGYISDRTKTRWGRRLPYMVAGILPLVLLYTLIWMPPEPVLRAGYTPLFIYFLAAIFLFDGIYTMVILNWTALFPEMFTSLGERASVSAWRQLFGNIGLILGVAIAPMVYGSIGWRNMGLIYGAITGLTLVIALKGSKEDPTKSAEAPLPVLSALRYTLANRSFLTYVLASMLIQFTFSLILATVPFYTKYVLRITDFQTTLMLLTTFVMVFLSLFIWSRITVKLGPRATMMVAIAAFGMALIPYAFIRGLLGALIAAVFLGVGLAGLMMLFDVLIADVIDEDAIRTGRRREGMYFGANALFIRLGISLEALALGSVMKATGYDPNLAMQPASAVMGIRLLMSGIPILALIIAAVFVYYYPLHGERLAQLKQKLAARSGEA